MWSLWGTQGGTAATTSSARSPSASGDRADFNHIDGMVGPFGPDGQYHRRTPGRSGWPIFVLVAGLRRLNGGQGFVGTAQPMAGWCPDPADPSRERFWDGDAWCDSCRPQQASSPLPPGWVVWGDSNSTPPRSKRVRATAIALVIIGAVELVIALNLAWGRISTGVPSGYDLCGVDTSGRAWCWGDHYGGSSPGEVPAAVRGLPEPSLRHSGSDPVPVGGRHTFTTITNDYTIACALDADGKAWCWQGPYRYDDPSEADEDYRDTPVAVRGGHSFTNLTAAGDFQGVCALDDAGKAWCWGA